MLTEASRSEERVETARIRRVGVFMLAAAAVLWSLNGLFVRGLNDSGLGGWSIAGFRSAFACMFLTPFVLRKTQPIADRWWLVGAVLCFTGMCATFVNAMTRTTVANALVLQYTAPGWVFLFSPLILRERATRSQLVALVFSLGGIAIIFGCQFSPSEGGLIIGLASGLVFGTQTVLFRRVRALDPMVLTWFACGGSSLALLAVASVCDPPVLTPALLGWLAVMGLFQFALPYVLFCAGIGRVQAQRAAMIILLEPLLSPVWVWLAKDEVPHGSTLVGGAFILAGVLYLSVVDIVKRPVYVES